MRRRVRWRCQTDKVGQPWAAVWWRTCKQQHRRSGAYMEPLGRKTRNSSWVGGGVAAPPGNFAPTGLPSQLSLEGIDAKVNQLSADMRAFMNAMSSPGQRPVSGPSGG